MLKPQIACLLLVAALMPAVHAAPPKKLTKKPVANKPAPNYVKGTTQMAGGQGLFGQTYTLVGGSGYGPINFTLVSAEYSVERMNMTPTDHYAPKADEKLLVIHYRIKNPNKDHDFYYSSGGLFQTVDANNTTKDDQKTSRRESQKDLVTTSIKPGQGIDDLITYAIVPAKGAIPKLILQLGRAGSKDLVTRYTLAVGPNKVKPLAAPYADPSDPMGATALAEIPAKIGTTYTAGYFDMSLDSVALVPSPIGDKAAEEGKRFLVATVTLTNKTWGGLYLKGDSSSLPAVLVTSDDEKATSFDSFKGKRDEAYDGETIEENGVKTIRLLFQVPKNVTGKTLKLAEGEDNSGGVSHTFVYDISDVK